MASWFERKIRRYEHMRWAQEPNRRTLPFAWGLEHIGANGDLTEPREFLAHFAERTLQQSDDWYSTTAADDYRVEDDVLTFTSAITSPCAENNRVHGQLFRAKDKRRAAVVLAQWNARWEEQQNVCRWLQRLGITAIKMSLPYHDRRVIPGHPRGDHLVGPNVGLTMQAMRQAVLDVRRTLRWLEQRGYERLGVLGTSIGSAIGFITMCHEPAIRAGAFLHASTYFGDVVASGLTTMNVWAPMATAGITREEVRHFWSPISPYPYISKLRGAGKRILLITGKYDPTFWPELTEKLAARLRREEVEFEHRWLPCGHYSMGEPPFSYIAGYKFGMFLKRALAK